MCHLHTFKGRLSNKIRWLMQVWCSTSVIVAFKDYNAILSGQVLGSSFKNGEGAVNESIYEKIITGFNTNSSLNLGKFVHKSNTDYKYIHIHIHTNVCIGTN